MVAGSFSTSVYKYLLTSQIVVKLDEAPHKLEMEKAKVKSTCFKSP